MQEVDDFYPGYIPDRIQDNHQLTDLDKAYIHPIHNEIQETENYNYPSKNFQQFTFGYFYQRGIKRARKSRFLCAVILGLKTETPFSLHCKSENPICGIVINPIPSTEFMTILSTGLRIP